MNSRTRKPSKSPHKAASTPNTHLETKITQKKMQTHRENSENQCLETPVKNNRENYMPTGTGAVKDDNENSEKTRIFYSSDEEQDDINAIFEPKVSKSQNSFPRTNSEVNLKERKFFKRSYPETLNHGICLSPRTVELQEENVSKVFKILSKSVSTPNFSESKPSKRLPLKTYSTPRKPKTNIIESFGLPDTPIIPEFPSKFDELDVGVTDAKDVTVCDMPFFEVDEVLPLKQYEKGYNCNISKQDNEDEAIFVQKNTSDHKILIEKMKNQIRRLLSDSPTRSKEKSTSTPIQTNKLSVLACDVSCIEDNSLDMEIFNTSDKTGILFSLPDLSHNENKIEKIKNVISTTSTSFKRALRSSDSSGKDDKTQNAYSSFESSDKVNTPKSKSDMRSNSKKRGNKSVQSDKADETVNVCSSFESSDRVNMPKSKSDRSNSKKRGNKPLESDKGDKIENVCSSFESSDKVNTRKNKSDKRSNSKKRGNKSEESEKDEKMCIASSSLHSNEKVKTPTNKSDKRSNSKKREDKSEESDKDEKMCIASSSFHSNEKVKTPKNKSNKRSNSKKRGNKSEESDKDEKMCIASSSFHSNEKVKTPTNKSDKRSNSKKEGNECAQSSTISDFTDKINKRQTRSNTSKQLQSPNYGLELKVLLNPLSENVLSNYSVYQNLSNISLKDNLKTCQQFLEHEKQNICQPFDSSIVCSILGDWENADSEVFPQKNTQTPIKFNSAYEFNEISPDKIIEKLSYKNKCRSVVALLTDQDALNESPKTENHLSDKKEIRNEFINNKIGNKMNVKPVPKEEVKLPQIEGNNFSIIQYMSIEESYENVQQQEILILETSNNLELVVNKENSLMNGSEVVENDESLFYDETETNSEDLQNLQNSLSDGIKITNEEKSIVDKADENDLNLVISGEKVQDTSMESPNNTGCHIICDNNISNTVPESVENKTNESNLGPQELSQNQDSNNSVPLQCKPYSLNGFSENSFKESLHSKPKKLIESAKGLEKNNFGKQLDIILVNSDIQFQYQPDLNPKKNSKTPYINSTQIEKPVALEFESQIVAPENPYNISTEMGDHFKELINGEKHIKNEMSVKEPNIIDNCVTVSQCSQHIIEDYIEEFQKDPSETSVTVLQKKSEINETQSSSDIEEVCQHKNDSESKRKRVKKPYYKCRSSTRLEKSPFRTDTEDEVLDNCDYSSTKSDTEVNYIKELTECEKGKTSKANFEKDKNSAEAMEPNNTEMEKGVEADKNDETMGIELNNFKKQLDIILINGDHQIEYTSGLKNKTHKTSIQLEHGIIRTKSLENEPVEDSDQSTAPIHIRHSDNEQQILDNHFENSSISGDIIGKEITVSDRNSSEVNSLALHTNSEGNEQQSPDSPITNDAEIKRKKMYFKCRSSIRLEKSHIPVTTDIENEFIENLESLTTRSDNGVIGSTKLTEDEATKKILENVEGNQSTAAIHNTHSDNGPTILDDHFENSPCSGYIIGKGVTESDGTLIENNPSEGNSLALHENLEEDELQSPDSPITDDTEMKRKSLKKMYFKCRSSIRLEKSHIPVTTDIETEFIENSASLPTESDSGVIGSTELTEQEATKKKALEKVEGKTETPKLENITVERSVKQLGPEEDMEKEIDYNSKDNATTKNSSAINEVSGDTDPAYVKLKDIVKNHNEMDMNDVQSENDSLPPQNMPTPTEKPGRLRKKSFIRLTDDQLNSTDNCTISSKAQKSDFSQDEVDIEGTLEKNTVGEENKTNTLVDDHNVLVSPKTGRKPPKKTLNEVMDNQLNNTGHNESCFTTGEGKVTTVEDAEGNKKKLATEPDTLMSPKNRRRQRKKSQGHQLLNNTDNYVGFSKAHEYDSNSSADEGEIRAVDQKTIERDASNTATTVQISNALMSPRKKGKPHKKPLVEVTDDELYNTDNIIDGKNVAIEDAVNADTLVNDFNILVSPRKKGRPRKKPFIEITDDEITIIDNNIVLPKAHDSYSSLNENEIKSLGEKVAIGDEACTDSSVNEPNLILIPKKKGRPRKKTRKTAMGNSVITATLVNKPNMLLPKKKGRPHKKPLIEVTDVQLNNTFSSIDSPKAHIDEDENKAAKETVAMGDADNVVTVLNEFNDLERPRKRGRPRKKLLTEVTDDNLNKKDNSIDSSKRNNCNSSLDEDEIESVGAIEDVNRMDPNVLMSPKKKGRPRKIVSSSVEDICNIPKRKGRPRKNSNLQERESIVPITSPLAKTETQNILVSASPKAFEGFEKTEKTEECNNVCHLNLEQIEAELVAIEYQKEGGEFAPLFRKLTRSKSRAALKDFEEDTNLISDKDVQLPRRSKTSLGLVLKNSPDFPRRSKGRPRASGTVEGETSNDSGKSMFESIKKKKDKYNLGTLAWARIGGYPYWPCLVTKEPDNNVFKKDSFMAGSMKTIYHVRFFGDKGKRAWVVKTKMMPYNDKNDVELLLKKAKEENKPLHERLPYMIRPLYVEKWKKAVNEAEQLKESPLPEKLSFFEQIDIRRKIEKLARKSDHDLPGTSKRKRKDSMSTISSETSQITDFQDESPTRKRYKKDGTSKRVSEEEIAALSKKCKDPPQPAEPEPVVIPPYVPILDNENILPSRTRSGLHNEVNSDIMPKVSSEKTATPPDPFSIEAQRSLFRRNNLFKGVSKEKACQYCYQPDMVFKCTKGGCNGLYHLQCSVDVMTGEEYNKRKNNRKSSQSAVIELNPNENDPKSSETTGNNPPDDRVQIVTVTSHIYNTPPRKTFPENFQAMSLAEQIDFKMKEVMRKFENRTLYAESSTDSSSEESSVAKMISMIKNSPNVKLTFDHLTPDKNILDEKFTDKPNGTFPDIPRKHRTSIVKHVTADSVIEMSSDESSPSTTRHVTADSVEVNEKVDKGKTLLKKLVTAESDLERTPSESSCSTISQQSKEMLDPKNFKCGFCLSRTDPYCFICRQAVTAKGSLIRQKCSLYQCGRYFHPECLKLWPQTQWSFIQTTKHRTSKEEFDTFVCPQHVCHTCSSDDPRAATSRCSGDKIVKCLRCPASYHSTNFCIPAGTEIISTTQVICPRHRDRKKATINTTWCFLCSEGGNLICCETCPTSVHPECMPVNLTDDDKFICEDCESGRLPLYDEIVWVKLGAFRWWPALILFPNEVPPNVMNARHSAGEFVVRFFGTYDHYWVSRSRSFLFQDGDAGQTTSTKKKVDEAFNRAVEEAVVAHKAKKEFKRTREVESLNSLKPPPYIRIKVNRPVGNVRQLDLDLSSTTSCDCNPNKPNPCEPDSDCLNRLLMTECNPEVCPAGQRCKNQSFEKREYPPMTPYKTEGRGWGLKALAPIKKGQFVIEYVGELIDMEEYQRRIQKMHEQKEENYYFLTIDKDRMIDAGPKGNLARFMNHCCLPNCETQKWTVNGDTRVGLFATVDIPAETELTFNYNLECVGKERKICRCGAPTCSGFIGVQKEKQESDVKKIKRSYKKKQPVEQAVLPPCFICQRKGNVGLCNNKVCNKAYHLRCLNMTEWPEGNKFVCPWHNCNICSKRTIRCCVKCINSFCPSHSEGNIRYDNLLGFVCSSHDPTKPQSDNPVRMKARRSHVITEESAVTSTTSDDSDKEDDMLLSDRINQKEHIEMEAHSSKRPKKGKKRASNRTSSEEFEVSNSTSLSVVQDEYNVSSATPCGSEQTRRKKSVKRNDQTRKKIRLSSLGNNKRKSTARSNLNSRQLDDR